MISRLLGIALDLGKTLELCNIGPRKEQQRVALQAVAARTAGFLIVALDILRQVHMDDESHIRFVDAHPESDRRDDDLHVVVDEMLLIAFARLFVESGVIRRAR